VKKLLLTICLVLLVSSQAHAFKHMLFIANQSTATINEEEITFYVLHVDTVVYRIGTQTVAEPYAGNNNYYKVDIFSLAHEDTAHLLDVIMPNGYVNISSRATEFRAWSYTDLAARVIDGQINSLVLKKFLRVRYTVTPIDEEDSGNRDGTIEEYEADVAAGKAWGRAYIPHKWLGVDYEHEE
jgi:hypothetical protein